MNLGNSLFHARKKCGLSQEAVAEKLGVSRQTISKWEADETLPDIRQAKKMALLYHMTLGELIAFDMDIAPVSYTHLSACCSSREENGMRPNLVTPSTIRAMSLP